MEPGNRNRLMPGVGGISRQRQFKEWTRGFEIGRSIPAAAVAVFDIDIKEE